MAISSAEKLGFDPADCPIRNVLDRVGDQWTLLVLEALDGQVLRFNQLSRGIADISKQMLSRTLRRMEEDGFVTRTIYAEVPPRVEYALTDLGQSLLVPMKALVAWADQNHGAIRAARGRFTG
ncbi:helix-turn-helix transcriptional regulator [Xinfangfangia sp. D13-10-4-6]|uniref:winged helix-turn-helix transcriptional regulator n=1 Tax=Pseudogemmobacter hezensis TaxID=2737662 RepID=UPI0015517D66|nr:helix-turn-helix domain-containing protein [Pseudogemmobacter hezensis]NPD14780.1 helix-turn-helix transcriptional regulator [Pseudogemmobacter hezensis]